MNRSGSDRPPRLDLTRRATGPQETLYRWLFFACAALTVFVTVGIVIVLVANAMTFFARWPIWKFLTGTKWSPNIEPVEFGIWALVTGTLTVTVGSALIALPTGVAAAVYLSEYASARVRGIVKPFLEILAGVPTVVYGYFALVYITPALDAVLAPMGINISTFNALSASIVVGVMIIPFVASVSEDAIRAVPRELREAAYGVGATKFSVTIRVVIPAAFSGIVASFILALSRAIGETMAVTIAAGQNPRLVNMLDPEEMLRPIQTMTSAMVELGISDVSGDSVAYQSLFAVGLMLFLITLAMNILGAWVTARFREKYE